MGSMNNATTVKNSVPFSIRHYVREAREKDIRNNWPFDEKYLELHTKHGLNRLLPPFESPDSVRYNLFRHCAQEGNNASDNNPSIVNNKMKENSISIDEAVSEITKQMSPLSISINKHQQGDSGLSSDIPSPSMDQTIKSFCRKRRKHKEKPKKRSMEEIYANAKPCTLEELAIANGAVPYVCDHNGTHRKRCENESTTTVDPGKLKMPHRRDGSEDRSNHVGEKKNIIKIKFNSEADNRKTIS